MIGSMTDSNVGFCACASGCSLETAAHAVPCMVVLVAGVEQVVHKFQGWGPDEFQVLCQTTIVCVLVLALLVFLRSFGGVAKPVQVLDVGHWPSSTAGVWGPCSLRLPSLWF